MTASYDRKSDRYAFENGKEPWDDADLLAQLACEEPEPPKAKPVETGLNATYDLVAGESQDYPAHIRRWEEEDLRE